MTQAYPLHWPQGRPRAQRRERSRFECSFAGARDGLATELERLGAKNAILSTNVELRLDGQPYANRPEPSDPGVAVYFTYKGRPMAFACDRWDRIKDNIRAIEKTIEALRGIERWGTGSMVEAAFRGFEALPAPSGSVRPWWDVLQVKQDSPIITIENNYRSLARQHHPDNGGRADKMAELNAAIAEARKAKAA